MISHIIFCVLGLAFIITIKIKFKRSRTTENLKSFQKSIHRFSQLPSLPLIGVLHHIFLNKNDIGKLLENWRKNYGTCWKTKIFGKNILLIHDPAVLKILLESGDPGHLEKCSFIYDTLFVGASNSGLLSLPVKNWSHHRKILNKLFTYESVKIYIGLLQKHADQLVQNLKDRENYQPIRNNYADKVHQKTLDIIAEICIGQPLKTVVGKMACIEFHKNMKIIREIISEKIFAKPWQLVPLIWNFHPQKKKLDKSVNSIESIVHTIIKRHIPEKNSKFALDLMLNADWSDEEITSELLTLLVAGHETISSSLVFLLWLLALEQDHQIHCQKEVDKLFDNLVTSDQSPELSLSHLSDLKYLERCIKESLRLFPSTPFGTGRELKTPLKVDNDLIIEPGTVVMYSTYVLHRDPEIFQNLEKFDPDRFLQENVKNRHAFSFLPFSGGSRNCLGWKIALIELTVLCAVILRNFDLKTTTKRRDMKIIFSHTLYPETEPNIIFQRRTKSV